MAHTHSQLPETNKYKHDLALSQRKTTLESWRTAKQVCAKPVHLHTLYLQPGATNMQMGGAAVKNAGLE